MTTEKILVNSDYMTGERFITVLAITSRDKNPETRASAKIQVENIKSYWNKFGYIVEAQIATHPGVKGHQRGHYQIRTNLVDGLPKDWRG